MSLSEQSMLTISNGRAWEFYWTVKIRIIHTDEVVCLLLMVEIQLNEGFVILCFNIAVDVSMSYLMVIDLIMLSKVILLSYQECVVIVFRLRNWNLRLIQFVLEMFELRWVLHKWVLDKCEIWYLGIINFYEFLQTNHVTLGAFLMMNGVLSEVKLSV